jgi:hypothetical protein
MILITSYKKLSPPLSIIYFFFILYTSCLIIYYLLKSLCYLVLFNVFIIVRCYYALAGIPLNLVLLYRSCATIALLKPYYLYYTKVYHLPNK